MLFYNRIIIYANVMCFLFTGGSCFFWFIVFCFLPPDKKYIERRRINFMKIFTRIKNSQPMGPQVLADAHNVGRLGVRLAFWERVPRKNVNEEKNMKTNILINTVALCFILFEGSAKASLTDILSKYCVPTGASNCTGLSRATYNGKSSGNTCNCSACNMYYDTSTRTCKTCEFGTYVTNRNSTKCIKPNCGAGFYASVTTGTSCGAGYYRTKLSGCDL